MALWGLLSDEMGSWVKVGGGKLGLGRRPFGPIFLFSPNLGEGKRPQNGGGVLHRGIKALEIKGAKETRVGEVYNPGEPPNPGGK